ncbi:MAG: hypothetical protein NT013_03035 [Planctomycetia bacterium]|nr:hypothetical protein [Planctomycetia bacterium]
MQARIALRNGKGIKFGNPLQGVSPNEGKARIEVQFSNVDLDGAAFILQTRPFKKIEFRNVALQSTAANSTQAPAGEAQQRSDRVKQAKASDWDGRVFLVPFGFIQGGVVKHDPAKNELTIGQGDADGVRVGHRFYVVRARNASDGNSSSRKEGVIKVVSVGRRQSIATVLSSDIDTPFQATDHQFEPPYELTLDKEIIVRLRLDSEVKEEDRIKFLNDLLEVGGNQIQVLLEDKPNISELIVRRYPTRAIAKEKPTYPAVVEYLRGQKHITFAHNNLGPAVAANSAQALGADATTQRTKNFPTGSSSVKRIAYSADGKLIAIANDHSTLPFNDDMKRGVQILEAETGKTVVLLQITTTDEYRVLAATQGARESKVEAIAFSPDGNVVAVGTSIGQVKLFNARTGELLQSLEDEKARLPEKGTPETLEKSTPITRAMGSVASLAFSPDGSLLAMCGNSFDDTPLFSDGISRTGRSVTGPGRLKVWDVKTGKLKYDLVGHSHANAVTFSQDGNLLASAGSWENDREHGTGVIIWNPRDGMKVRTITNDANGGTRSVAFSPNSKLLSICSQRFDKENNSSIGVVSVAHVGSGVIEWQHTVAGLAKPVAFSPDGKNVIVLCSGQQSLRFLDTETGAVRHDIPSVVYPQFAHWNDFSIATRGSILAIGGSNETRKRNVELWDFAGLNTAAKNSN